MREIPWSSLVYSHEDQFAARFKMKSVQDVLQKPISEKLNRSVLLTLLCVGLVSLAVLVPFEVQMYRNDRDYAMVRLKKGIQGRILGIAQSGALHINTDLHYDLLGEKPDWGTPGFNRVQKALREIQRVNSIQEEIYTLRLKDRKKRLATFIVMSGTKNYIGNDYVFPKEMEKTIYEGIPAVTDIYESRSQEGGMWMSAFAPIKEMDSDEFAVLEVDVPVTKILEAFKENSMRLVFFHSLRGAILVVLFILLYLIIRILIKRSVGRLIRVPLEIICKFIHRVRDGILESDLKVESGDELEVLANSFNEMVDGLRQKETMSHFLTNMEMLEVEAVTEGRKELGTKGDKRRVAILFCDIRGFTSICEDVEPERIILALNLYFDQMVPIIENWKGSLDKLIGDCIMAVFEESDGFRESEAALNCAIEMQALMEFVRDDLRSQNLPEFHVGFGVNTGPSVVGNLGAKSQLSRTVLGDSVNLAARVEALSKDGIESKVLFTEFTLEQLRIAPRHKLLMETIVKGKTNLVKVFEVDSEEVALKRSSMRTD